MKQNKQMRSGKLAASSLPAHACTQTANNFGLHPNTRIIPPHACYVFGPCFKVVYDRDFYSPALVGGSAGPAVLPFKGYSHAGRRACASCNYLPTVPLCVPADSHPRAVDFEPPAHHGQSKYHALCRSSGFSNYLTISNYVSSDLRAR
eukprot:3861153-Pleurochrysis_carterae.AAC.1